MTLKFRKRKKNMGDTKDRISSLPDEVICHILSFIPTKDAVGTSVVSKRWKHLWASVPSLYFIDDVLLFPNKGDGDCFVNFVDKVLTMRQDSNIQKLSLICHNDHDLSCIDAWINTAIRYKVREITLHIIMDEYVVLPPRLFTCDTLVVLILFGNLVVNFPESACLPNLKALHLFGVDYMFENTTEMLFPGCPLLEDLYVLTWIYEKPQVYIVRASSLKHFMIGFHSKEVTQEDEEGGSRFKLVVDAPNLETLFLISNRPGDYEMDNVSSLSNVIINVEQVHEGHDFRNHGNHVIQLYRGISNVKVMCLSGETVQFLYHVDDRDMPTFHNLKYLILSVEHDKGWNLVPKFLKYSPKLEAFVLRKGTHSDDQLDFDWFLPKCVPNCLLFHLKEIQIGDFGGNTYEFKLVRYLLKKAKVLEKIEIHFLGCLEDGLKMKVRNKILKLPRGSNACQVEFF